MSGKHLFTFLICNWIFSNPLHAVVESKFRPQLRSAFASSICNKSFPNHPLEIWKLGIYEAQIIGKAYAPYNGKHLTSSFLSAQSKSLSRKHNHRSRIWGVCKDGTGWIGSWPAPEPMQIGQNGLITVPYNSLQSMCSTFRIDFAAQNGGQPKRLAFQEPKPSTKFLTIDTAPLESGTIALTCYPKEPDWQGPVMWYFAPVKSGPNASVPMAEMLYGKRELRNNLLAWINAVRQQEKLKPLSAGDKHLNVHAQSLTHHPDLLHDRRELASIAELLKSRGRTFLGENRYQGQSNLELAWLLWNSPRHRALILSPQGNYIGMGVQITNEDKFGVIIVAQ